MSWLFLLFDLLIPMVLVAFGLCADKIAEGEINFWIGYRTDRSTASREAWEYANRLLGKILLREGAVEIAASLIFGVLAMILCQTEVQGTISVLLVLIESVSLVPVIPYIEGKLKERNL